MAGNAQKDKAQGDNMQKIDLTTLTLPQLSQLKQQLEQVSVSLFYFIESFITVFFHFPLIGFKPVPRFSSDFENCTDKISRIS